MRTQRLPGLFAFDAPIGAVEVVAQQQADLLAALVGLRDDIAIARVEGPRCAQEVQPGDVEGGGAYSAPDGLTIRSGKRAALAHVTDARLAVSPVHPPLALHR
jgi:hypothetical protein